jgi:hypothetical protein
MFLALLIVTATFRPPHPTVGDPITIDFAQPVVVDVSPAYEVVSQHGRRVVVRTFEPRPFALSGSTAGVRFRNLVVPVRSVLAPKDTMQPAPLKPPRQTTWPREPFIAIAAAALLACAAWAAVYAVERRAERARRLVAALPPAHRFRAAVSTLRDSLPPQHWAALADALREYLGSRGYGADLTTSQILGRLGDHELIADVLRRGDLEKFSPWGVPAGDFDSVASRALDLPDELEPKAEAA